MSDDLAAFLGAVAALYFATRAVLALPADTGGSLVPPALAAVALVVLLAYAKLAAWRGGAARGRASRYQVDGDDRADAARHEAGHAAVGKHVGAEVGKAWINDTGGGAVEVYDQDHPPEERIAVSLGGAMAEGASESSWQARGDRKLIGRALGGVPWLQQGAVMARARGIARTALAAETGYRARVERQLLRRGRM